MKMKTGFITVVMSLVLLAILSGCCANGSSSGQNQSGGTQATASGSQGKVLVVFFSATGNTKAVAQMIAGDLGGTTFEITPKTPYTTADLDWSDANSRVSKEYADTSLRSVELTTTTVADWSSYDTVFVGYPIWWGIAAWPVNNFVRGNDFSGKTVILFATSSSSGMGQSGTLLEEMANGGTWQSGQRFSSGATNSTVRDWAAGLGL